MNFGIVDSISKITGAAVPESGPGGLVQKSIPLSLDAPTTIQANMFWADAGDETNGFTCHFCLPEGPYALGLLG